MPPPKRAKLSSRLAALKSRTQQLQKAASLIEKERRDRYHVVLSVARYVASKAKVSAAAASRAEHVADGVLQRAHANAVAAVHAMGDEDGNVQPARYIAITAVGAVADARVAVNVARNMALSARECANVESGKLVCIRSEEEQRRTCNANVPLDWLNEPDIDMGLPWTRAAHILDPFCNATLSAFLLGLHVLSIPDEEGSSDELPVVDPELIEEALGTIRLFGATHYIKTARHTFFSSDKKSHLFSGAVSIQEPLWSASAFAFDGVIYGTKITRATPFGNVVLSYVGYMGESMQDSKPSMHPSGKGSVTYKDGSVYTGAFRGGIPFGEGTLCDLDGPLYIGHWNANPSGKGMIRVAPGVYHQGSFVDGFSTSVDLDLVSDDGSDCPSAIAPIGKLSDKLAARLNHALTVLPHGTKRLLMSGTDLLGVAHLLLSACHNKMA